MRWYSWQENLKNAMDQVNPEVRVTMEKIEQTHWGKGEREEWLEKEGEVRESMMLSTEEWGKMKRDLNAVLIDKPQEMRSYSAEMSNEMV